MAKKIRNVLKTAYLYDRVVSRNAYSRSPIAFSEKTLERYRKKGLLKKVGDMDYILTRKGRNEVRTGVMIKGVL